MKICPFLIIPHAYPAFLKYALLVIKNAAIKKLRPFFVFMEEAHLPQSQASLREGKMFHYKIHSRLYQWNELFKKL